MTQRTPDISLHNINLLVQDVERSRRFYETVLGWSVDIRRSAPPAMLILASPQACSLSLKAVETEAVDKRAGPGDIELGFATAALDEVHAAMTAFGVVVGEVVEQGFGRTFDAQDPDGHHLVVYSLRPENR